MLKRCMEAEWIKMRRSRVWIALLILPLFSALIGTANFYFNREVLQNEWYSLWSQVGLFYGMFFLPLLVAVACAFSYRQEHHHHNWYSLMTAPLSVSMIFISKLVLLTVYLFIVQIFMIVLYTGAGLLLGFSLPIPHEVFGWAVRGWLASTVIASFQLYLSQRIRSFAIPVGISLACVFLGLGIYVAGAGMFFPHSLLTIGLGVLSQEALSFPNLLLFTVVNICFMITFSFFAIRHLNRADIVA